MTNSISKGDTDLENTLLVAFLLEFSYINVTQTLILKGKN